MTCYENGCVIAHPHTHNSAGVVFYGNEPEVQTIVALREENRNITRDRDACADERDKAQFQLKVLREENERLRALYSVVLCECGHAAEMHEGHTHKFGSVPPNHCASLFGCHAYRPAKSLLDKLAAAESRLEKAEEVMREARTLVDRCYPSVTNYQTRTEVLARIDAYLEQKSRPE